MRNLLALLGLAALAFAVVGWWQGWYEVRRQPSADGQSTLNIKVYPGKVGDDTSRWGNKVVDLVEKARPAADKAEGPPSSRTDGPAPQGRPEDFVGPRLPSDR